MLNDDTEAEDIINHNKTQAAGSGGNFLQAIEDNHEMPNSPGASPRVADAKAMRAKKKGKGAGQLSSIEEELEEQKRQREAEAAKCLLSTGMIFEHANQLKTLLEAIEKVLQADEMTMEWLENLRADLPILETLPKQKIKLPDKPPPKESEFPKGYDPIEQMDPSTEDRMAGGPFMQAIMDGAEEASVGVRKKPNYDETVNLFDDFMERKKRLDQEQQNRKKDRLSRKAELTDAQKEKKKQMRNSRSGYVSDSDDEEEDEETALKRRALEAMHSSQLLEIVCPYHDSGDIGTVGLHVMKKRVQRALKEAYELSMNDIEMINFNVSGNIILDLKEPRKKSWLFDEITDDLKEPDAKLWKTPISRVLQAGSIRRVDKELVVYLPDNFGKSIGGKFVQSTEAQDTAMAAGQLSEATVNVMERDVRQETKKDHAKQDEVKKASWDKGMKVSRACQTDPVNLQPSPRDSSLRT